MMQDIEINMAECGEAPNKRDWLTISKTSWAMTDPSTNKKHTVVDLSKYGLPYIMYLRTKVGAQDSKPEPIARSAGKGRRVGILDDCLLPPSSDNIAGFGWIANYANPSPGYIAVELESGLVFEYAIDSVVMIDSYLANKG